MRSLASASATMGILHLFSILFVVYFTAAAPTKTKFETGTTSSDSQPFVEEVVVESVLQVRSPSSGRQARTNSKAILQDGIWISDAKPDWN